ncbi:hypothetical protein CEXT_790141 [Caerostris extrusa]|uniref:Uncharacterized protein n=1 Tax=Caerostris extrusa TaxID=172846 RepID=A0AAV4TMQ5_CAEEX|nr:hypothetical protein CEXT_790141 [Caerostris extrusa]
MEQPVDSNLASTVQSGYTWLLLYSLLTTWLHCTVYLLPGFCCTVYYLASTAVGRVGTAGVFEQDNEANLPLIFRTSNYIRASLAFHVTVYYSSLPFLGEENFRPSHLCRRKKVRQNHQGPVPRRCLSFIGKGPLPRQPDGSTRVLWVTPTSN